MTNITKLLATIFLVVLTLNLASAVVINSVSVDPLSPGEEGKIDIEVENIFADDVTDVSISLSLANLPFIPLGASEDSVDEIKEDDSEDFIFTIKASNDAVPGDYEIPYTLQYDFENKTKTREGSLGVKVEASPELTFSANLDNPVAEQKGKITLKIVNQGFSDARFLSVRIIPNGFTLLSDAEVYIGNVDSDDFETASFDVKFDKTNPTFEAIVSYKDFDNKQITKNVDLPLNVYTKEKALELGIIQKSNVALYIGVAVFLVLVWILWRILRKRARLKRSMEARR